MSDKMTCPGCDAHTSSVLGAVERGEPCPYCGLSAETIERVHLGGGVEAGGRGRVKGGRAGVEAAADHGSGTGGGEGDGPAVTQQRYVYDGAEWRPVGEPVEVPVVSWPAGACTVWTDGGLRHFAEGELTMSMPARVIAETLRGLASPSGEAGERSDTSKDLDS